MGFFIESESVVNEWGVGVGSVGKGGRSQCMQRNLISAATAARGTSVEAGTRGTRSKRAGAFGPQVGDRPPRSSLGQVRLNWRCSVELALNLCGWIDGGARAAFIGEMRGSEFGSRALSPERGKAESDRGPARYDSWSLRGPHANGAPRRTPSRVGLRIEDCSAARRTMRGRGARLQVPSGAVRRPAPSVGAEVLGGELGVECHRARRRAAESDGERRRATESDGEGRREPWNVWSGDGFRRWRLENDQRDLTSRRSPPPLP